MSKRLKALIAGELARDFQGLDSCVIMSLSGVPAVKADKVRADLRSKNMRLRVVKNTLASIAFKEAGLAGVGELLEGSSAVVTGGGDIVELVKAACGLAKDEAGLVVRGGYGEGKVLTAAQVEELSRIPGRQELLGSLAYAMSSAMGNFAGVLGAVQRKFVYALKALEGRAG
jgi:large subunit ribosomal protein L10